MSWFDKLFFLPSPNLCAWFLSNCWSACRYRMLRPKLLLLLTLVSVSNAGAGWIREIFESLNLLSAIDVDSVQSKQTVELQLNEEAENEICVTFRQIGWQNGKRERKNETATKNNVVNRTNSKNNNKDKWHIHFIWSRVWRGETGGRNNNTRLFNSMCCRDRCDLPPEHKIWDGVEQFHSGFLENNMIGLAAGSTDGRRATRP